MPLDPQDPYSYSRTKKNLLGKEKTKQISEQKYNKLSTRYIKRGGSSATPEGYMTSAQVRRKERSNIKPLSKTTTTPSSAQIVKNKRGTKTLIKHDVAIGNRNREVYNALQKKKDESSIKLTKSPKTNPNKPTTPTTPMHKGKRGKGNGARPSDTGIDRWNWMNRNQ